MATCCIPRCVACYDVVRYCPRCEASFAVCSAHRYAHLQCPWPTLSGIPCLTHVPMDRHWRAPLTYGPMYICPPADMGEPPPGLHRVTDTEHISTTRSSEGSDEPPVNTDVRDRKGNRTRAIILPTKR
jgi:hypothetical protein